MQSMQQVRNSRSGPHSGPTAFASAHVVSTVCPLDCPDSCSLDVTVRNGRIAVIDGSHANPVTGGYICAKVRRFGERVYGADRLLSPAVRKGPKGVGSFARVSWDEALGTIAARMREARDRWGGQSILPYSYGGSNGLLTQDTSDATLFRRLGASQLARTVCAAPTGAANMALYGKMPSVTYEDYPEARLIILWGANPSASGIHLIPYIREARRKGARLIAIDPRTTPLARQADLHLAVRPGTDLVVALAVHRYLFEEGRADQAFLAAHTCGANRLREKAQPWTFERAAAEAGVSVDALRQLAEWYAEASPALIRCGWGQERNRNGGNASLAILALPAVAGKFGVRGGGYTMRNSASWGIPRSWIGADEPATRLVNMNQLGRALLEYDTPPVKVLFVYNSNAAVTTPNQRKVLAGLERDDLFTVVFEQVMTDTARYADVLLPATTFLEGYDLARAYGPIALRLGKPVVEPAGESRSNADVFGELTERLGLQAACDPRGELEEMLDVLGRLPEPMASELREHGVASPPFDGRPIQFTDVWPLTPGRTVNLFPDALDADAPAGLYGYQPDPATPACPLALISPASERTISSTLAELPRPDVRLLMHPDDAGARGLREGDAVRVFNDLGEVRCRVAVGAWIRPGTVSLPKGLWRRHTANGYTATALAPDTLTDLGGGACFNDARVQVEKVGSRQ
ncbi:MAG: molybdopterin-dependent oxidoreductase [Acidobacteria bacterium]|nr:molybdopterin-dependent oxidoreductase [Acidobacteriota bacterium]